MSWTNMSSVLKGALCFSPPHISASVFIPHLPMIHTLQEIHFHYFLQKSKGASTQT